MVWQRAGTVSVQNGSTTVSGTNVDFAASSRVGDSFVGPDGATYEVANVASASVISILPAYKGPTVSGAAYAIMPVQGYDKMLSDAFNNLNNLFGPKLAALGTTGNYDVLPQNKGGTGASDGRPKFASLSLSSVLSGTPLAQGAYMGWNSGEASGFGGEFNFLCNRGGGTGGFTWRSINSDNTATGPVMTYSYGGVLTLPTLSVTNEINSALRVRGLRTRNGISGSYGGNNYNFNWYSGALEAWIDATYVGNVNLVTSDYRIKKQIKSLSTKFSERINSYRVVTYRQKTFSVWKDDGRDHQGLIAHEAQEVNPLAVVGLKDGMAADGENPIIQQLDPMALITDLIGGLQEALAEIKVLREEVATLKAPASIGD